jgi:hypothetical protein
MMRLIDMICHKLLIHITIITNFIALAYAMPPMLVDSNDLDWVGNSPGDPLDPSFVGETMSMPLDPELIQKARDAGIIKDYNPSYESGINVSLAPPFSICGCNFNISLTAGPVYNSPVDLF